MLLNQLFVGQSHMPGEIITPINPSAVQELVDCFEQGPILDEQGIRFLNEALIERIGGLKVEIYSQEHPPPHFHVVFQGSSNFYSIEDCSALGKGLDTYYYNIKKWHKKHKALLVKAWNDSRPTDCKVGKYKGS
jgi:hypothetical protein